MIRCPMSILQVYTMKDGLSNGILNGIFNQVAKLIHSDDQVTFPFVADTAQGLKIARMVTTPSGPRNDMILREHHEVTLGVHAIEVEVRSLVSWW